MSERDYLGEFEQIVLLAIIRLGSGAYGMTIRREIETRTGRNISIGALYATLERMERKGLVDSSLGEATAARGGRAKRFYTVNSDGREMLHRSLQAVQKMTEGYFPIPAAI